MTPPHVPSDDSHEAQTRPEGIAELLIRRIVRGEFPAGSKLPPERELSATYDTTRNVIREAIKRLESIGLVRSRRGSGVYVQNMQFTGGVELFDILMKDENGKLNGPFLKDVLEFRGHVIRLIIRLAADRCTDEELAAIRQLVKDREAARGNTAESDAITQGLFQRIAYASHNQVCQLLFNTVERVSDKLRILVDVPVLGWEESQRVFVRLIDAFERHDAVMAELVVIRYIEAVEKALSPLKSPVGMLHVTPAGG